MHKLKLQLDDLRVETFTTAPSQKAKGTVFGEQCTCNTACTCPGDSVCDVSCDGNCSGLISCVSGGGKGCTCYQCPHEW